MAANTSTKQEQQWQAEEDARAMARYQEILSDKSRMNRAVKIAKKQATDLNRRAEAMNKAAKVRTRK